MEMMSRQKCSRDQEVDDVTSNCPRADSEEQLRISSVPAGLKFFSIVNRRGRGFIPSTKNYFGSIQVSKVLCESGCSTVLIPIETPSVLNQIFIDFNDSNLYRFAIGHSTGVGGRSLCLKVSKHGYKRVFSVLLGEDILGEELQLEYLRFSLSGDDIRAIVNTPQFFARFYDNDQRQLSNAKDYTTPRRSHALLGQLALYPLSSMKHDGCEMFFDASKFPFPANLTALVGMVANLSAQARHEGLPERFDDWEDDNLNFDDDEDVFIDGRDD